MVATLLDKAEHCSMCGLTEREYAEDPDRYVALQKICPWCALKDRARSDGDTSASIPGSSVTLVTAEAAERIAESRVARPMSRRERAKKL